MEFDPIQHHAQELLLVAGRARDYATISPLDVSVTYVADALRREPMVGAVMDFAPSAAVTVEAPDRMTTLFYANGDALPQHVYVATCVYENPASLAVTAHQLFIADARREPPTLKAFTITADGLEPIDLSNAGLRSVSVGETLAALHMATTPPALRNR